MMASNDPGKTHAAWRVIIENLMPFITVVTAVSALVLSRLGLISDAVLPPIIVALLALLTTTLLVDHRRSLLTLSHRMDSLVSALNGQTVHVVKFESADSALAYLTAKTKSARSSIDQASIDKQRARHTSSREDYEKAREDVVLSDHLKYRYVGLVNDSRRFMAVKKLLEQKRLHNFYAAFQRAIPTEIPLFNFTIFDKEEVVARAPYDLGEDPVYFAIRSPELASLFVGYFEKLWLHSIKVDKPEDIDHMRAQAQYLEASTSDQPARTVPQLVDRLENPEEPYLDVEAT
jgi:hypothetical protein